MSEQLKRLLDEVKNGTCSIEEAYHQLNQPSYADLNFAKVDLSRKWRQNVSEIIYGEGKTADQILQIARTLYEAGQKQLLITRLDPEKASGLKTVLPEWTYHETAQLGQIGENHLISGRGDIVVVCAGTSDLPIAEEAALTAAFLGNTVRRLYDVGVAGLHRLLAHQALLESASVVIVVAGMEGALASVVGGLVDCPVIAVPTSVGYGAAFGGLAALLSMLNSCATGVGVVNIDNGFGAGFLAHKINRP